MVKNFLFKFIISFVILSFFIKCDNTTEPKQTKGIVKGTVKNVLGGNALGIHSAYIFINDSLVAKTDESGKYLIASIEEASYFLTCSALDFRDTTMQVNVIGGKTVTRDFFLTPDSTTGKVFGEFQDLVLFNDSLQTNPSLKFWDARDIFDGVTGATLQSKTLLYEVPDRTVLLDDSILAVSDGFGQFWFEMQCGTYCLKGCCEGYQEATQVIKVLPNTRNYVNFFLDRAVVTRPTLKKLGVN